MRELKMKVWVDNSEMIGPFDLSQDPKYWAHQLKDGERLLFTGLTDKNGVEIFEGDILADFYGKHYEVIYERYMFNLKGFYDSSSDYPADAFSEGVFEVKGNRFENPELIEEQS